MRPCNRYRKRLLDLLVIQIVIGSQRYSIAFVMCILAFFKQNEEQKKILLYESYQSITGPLYTFLSGHTNLA
jgi:hypothetical protein